VARRLDPHLLDQSGAAYAASSACFAAVSRTFGAAITAFAGAVYCQCQSHGALVTPL